MPAIVQNKLEGLQRLFAQVHELFRQGWTAADIAYRPALGFNPPVALGLPH